MQLNQALAQVRVVLNEATPRFWTDNEIVAWLNEAATLMCSEAKCLTNYYQTPTVAQQQEYPLPEDVDEVACVWYSQGTILLIKPLEEALLKAGAKAVGLPLWCYFRIGALNFANVTGTADITVTPINTQRRKPPMVIGLYPIPANDNVMTVQYYARHYTVGLNNNMTDEFAIPDEYMRGVIAYAAALGKAKEQAVAEFEKQMGIFKEFKDRFVEKMGNNGQLIDNPRMKIRGRGTDQAGSSWIYVGDATSD
jgi:hypothetical protein